MSDAGLLQRLKDRKVAEWTLAYLAGAWVVFEATGTAADVWGTPAVLLRSIHVLLFIGFFAAVVLAWFHGEKGRQRVGGLEAIELAVLLAVAGGLLSWVGGSAESEPELRLEPEYALRTPGEVDAPPTVAIMPFQYRSSEGSQQHVADGLCEELITRLQGLGGLRVIARTTTDSFRDSGKTVRQVAEEIGGVDYVVEGSVQTDGDRLLVTVQLIDAVREDHLWAESFQRQITALELVGLLTEVARKIAFSLGREVSPGDVERARELLTENTEAYLLYLRANREMADEVRLRIDSERYESTELFAQAVEADPEFAMAHARLALSILAPDRMADSEKLDRALEHATRALDLIPGLAEAELAIGFYLFRTGDRSGALAQLEDVVRAHPNFPAALFGLGIVQAWGWDLPPDWNTRQAGIENMLKAARLDPANPDVHGWAVQFLQTEHRFEEAFEYLDRYDRLTGKPSNIYRAWMHLATGNQKRARSFAEIILAEDPGFFPRITMRAPFDVIRRAVLTHAEREAAFGTLASVERTLPDGTSVGSMGVGCSDDPGWALTNCIRRALHFEAQRDSLAARAAWDSLAVIMAANPSSISFKEAPFIYLGARDTVRALEAAEGLVRRHPHQQLSKLILARVFAEFGQSDRAITLLEEQLEPPSWVTVPLLRVDPWWDPLRDHPRFQALLAGGEPDQVF